MLVDTGATVVALRHEDAAKMGINPAPSDFTIPISTANGELKAAPARLGEARWPYRRCGRARRGDAARRSRTKPSRHELHEQVSGFEVSGGQLILKP